MSAMGFLERALEQIEKMSPEEVLVHHLEAQELIQDPVLVELYRHGDELVMVIEGEYKHMNILDMVEENGSEKWGLYGSEFYIGGSNG